MLKILIYFIEVNMINPLFYFVGENILKTLIYVFLTIAICMAFWRGVHTIKIVIHSDNIEGDFLKRLKEPYVEQYVYKYGGIGIKFKKLFLFLAILLCILISVFILFKTKSYYLFIALFGFVELFNALNIYINHTFFQNYLIRDQTNILKISIMDAQTYKLILSNYVRSGFILIISTLIFALTKENMFKGIVYVVLTLILIFTLWNGMRLNYKLIYHYKTDERRIYARNKEYGIKQYVKSSRNWKIKLQPWILIILMGFAYVFLVYVILELGFTKIYLLSIVIGLMHFYNAWTLYEDHIFINNYLKFDPTNILKLSALSDDVYQKTLRSFLQYGILFSILPGLFAIV